MFFTSKMFGSRISKLTEEQLMEIAAVGNALLFDYGQLVFGNVSKKHGAIKFSAGKAKFYHSHVAILCPPKLMGWGEDLDLSASPDPVYIDPDYSANAQKVRYLEAENKGYKEVIKSKAKRGLFGR